MTHVVSNNVRVTVRDMSRLGNLLDTLVSGEATHVSGLSFDVSDRDGAHERALADAMHNARSQAETLAAAAGVSLGDVLVIDTTYGQISAPTPSSFRAEADSAESVPVSSGSMDISARVGVVFSIR